jgi:hypothetical protein
MSTPRGNPDDIAPEQAIVGLAQGYTAAAGNLLTCGNALVTVP